MELENEPQIEFSEVLSALLDTSNTFPPRYLYSLSSLEGEDLSQLTNIWGEIDPLRKERLLEDLEMLAVDNFVVSFDEVYKLGLDDPRPQIRLIAIRALLDTEDNKLGNKFIKMLEGEKETLVVAQLASILGNYMFLAELEELPPGLAEKVYKTLLELAKSDQPDIVKQKALISIGYANNQDVAQLIENAYNQKDEDWIISALLAMKNAALPDWSPMIIEHLSSESSDVREAAAQAASEIMDKEMVPHLLNLIDDPEENVQFAAIWALSQIGGDDARLAIEGLLEKATDDEKIAYLEEALENLDLADWALNLDLLNLSEDDLEGMLGDFLDDEE